MKTQPKISLIANSALVTTLLTVMTPALADGRSNGWSIVPNFGFSQLSDQNGSISGSPDIDNQYNLEVDSGFNAGLGIRYRYGSKWESEIAWEYRSNDSTLVPVSGESLTGGNYASNIFFLNGRRYFETGNSWTPYVGAGLQIIQEIDVDYESADGERSFADSGALGFQLMAGISKPLGDRFTLSAEMRYGLVSGLTLESEESSGTIGELDYDPLTAQISLAWNL